MTTQELAKKILDGEVPFAETWQEKTGADLFADIKAGRIKDRLARLCAITAILFAMIWVACLVACQVWGLNFSVPWVFVLTLAPILAFAGWVNASEKSRGPVDWLLKDLELAAAALNRRPEVLLQIGKAGKSYIPRVVEKELTSLGNQIAELQSLPGRDRLNPSDKEKELVTIFRDGYPALELLGLASGSYGKYFPN